MEKLVEKKVSWNVILVRENSDELNFQLASTMYNEN